MDSEQPFDGFNDITAGAELFSALRVDVNELAFPQVADKMVDIADFVNKYPDALIRIRQAMHKMPNGASPIDHIHYFVGLQNRRMSIKAQLTELEHEISMYE